MGSENSGKVTRYRATPKLLELKREWELPLLEDVHLLRNTELDIPVHHALVVLHSGKKDRLTGRLPPVDDQKHLIPFGEEIEALAQRDGNGKPYPEAVKHGFEYLRVYEDEIERINRSNTRHGFQAWTTDPKSGREGVFPVNVCMRQVHVERFHRAARLYSFGELSGQNLSKETRPTMKIDGEPTAELDFSGMATLQARSRTLPSHFAKQ